MMTDILNGDENELLADVVQNSSLPVPHILSGDYVAKAESDSASFVRDSHKPVARQIVNRNGTILTYGKVDSATATGSIGHGVMVSDMDISTKDGVDKANEAVRRLDETMPYGSKVIIIIEPKNANDKRNTYVSSALMDKDNLMAFRKKMSGLRKKHGDNGDIVYMIAAMDTGYQVSVPYGTTMKRVQREAAGVMKSMYPVGTETRKVTYRTRKVTIK